MSDTQLTIELPEPWLGQSITVKTVLSARLAATLDDAQDDLVKAISTFEVLVISHNLKDLEGNPAASLLDVDLKAISYVFEKWKERIAGLPS